MTKDTQYVDLAQDAGICQSGDWETDFAREVVRLRLQALIEMASETPAQKESRLRYVKMLEDRVAAYKATQGGE